MKTIKYLFQLILASLLAVGATSCARDYDEPPFVAPEYTPIGEKITIADLKERYKDVSDPVLIDVDYYLEANVIANDISGNIFKQLYVQDATGGTQLGVDQNNVATEYGVGQRVFIQLHGLYILKYGGEFQLGQQGTNANRIPWEIFKEHVKKNDFAKPSNAVPAQLDIASLYDTNASAASLSKLVNTLVEIDNIHFVNGKDSLFIRGKASTIEDVFRDSKKNSVTMRTSSYATPFVGRYLPYGTGKVTGILGRHNGGWQFIVRDSKDVLESDFDGEKPVIDDGGTEGDILYETFGEGYYPSGSRPKINDFKDGDMKAPIKYTDKSGNADIRSISGAHAAYVWLPVKDAYFTIEGINSQGSSGLVLSYELAANLYNAGEATDLNVVTVTINGVKQTVASKPVSNANGDHDKFHTMVIENFPQGDNVTVEFAVPGTQAVGLRLDNIRIGKKGEEVIVPTSK